MRIYAVYNRSRRVLTVLVSIGGILMALSLFSVFFGQSTQLEETPTGCHTQLSFTTSISTSPPSTKVSNANLLDRNCRSLGGFVPVRFNTRIKIPLMIIILPDGSAYFSVMTFANAINISLFYSPVPSVRASLTTISVTMMSRLIFNLHKIADSGLHTSHIATLQLGGHDASLPDLQLPHESAPLPTHSSSRHTHSFGH
ncbi:hypothetical protein GYMLUDRAFT_243071 [Collybiopsis luxurians FD-317 M1]|uniref:Uncharacterized protein n=1 Tax=Collybiopsis luxurians FD-317 M1 TaxID=944289 RepID=A0A0D0C178_9AGAR|nr:hypothetical protein GYMLUDRAFT_243071 [Collybiopsis luxurians FD-317 M1]